jgi:Mannosyl-glycoprotein endo-beta-N-acetylglucosaminidase/Peptidase M15
MDRLVFASRVDGESGRPPLRDVFVPLGEVDEDEGYEDEGYEPELEDLAEATRLELQDEQGARYEGQPGTAVAPGRLVVDRLPLLRRHTGTPPDLLIKWNAMTAPTQLDVVVHLHGFSGRGRRMRLLRDKEPISGLDFADPADQTSVGRTTPALLVLPRGHFYGGRSGMGYTFPALERPGALDELIQDALARFTKATGAPAALGRRILTAHSGGGASLMAILRHTDPDEVHTFDALYNNPKPLIDWASRRAQRGEGALRVLYRRGEGTARNSERVHQALCPLLTPETRPRFRVERTSVRHLEIPARYGWRLLQDQAATLPETSPVACSGDARQVRQGELLAEPGWPSQDEHEQELYSDQHERYPGEPETLEPGLGQLEAEYDEYEEALQEHEDYEEVSELEAMHPSGLEDETFPSGAVLSPTTGPVGEREEHWDPNGVGLPLYDTGPATHALKLSPNFTVGELVTSGGRRADKARISAGLVHCLQAIRDRVGRPVRVTSGYRSWARNEATYKQRGKEATMSRHCSGQAVDITVRGMTGMEIAKAALDACGDSIGVGIGATFAHVDVRGSWARWAYLSGAAGRAAVAEIDTYRRQRKSSPAPAKAPATPVPPAPADPRPVPGTAGATPDRRAGRVRLGRFERCTKGPQPGAKAMAAQWTRLTGRKAGIHNCRRLGNDPKRGWSLHGEGRAIDLYARADRPDQRAQAEAYVAWLLANAVELQVAVVIWNRRIWSWLYRARGWRAYKDGPHIDHVHVDLSWEGALHPSPLLDGPVPAMDGQPASSSAPAPAPAPNGLAPEDVRAFVEQYGEPAVRGQELTGVPPLVTLGQAALESGWGTNAPGSNLFGGQGRDFPSAAEAFVAHGRLLRATRRYAGAFLHADDPHAFAAALAEAGYASSPDYGEQLTAVMRLLERAAPNLDRPVPAATELEAEEMAWLPEVEVERRAPPGPRCPDVVVPPSKRPAALKRHSVHPAVREAQRKLNGLHLYLVAAGLPGLRGAPLVEDCDFGTHTVDAVRSFQELVFPGEPNEHDGEIGPRTWTQLDAIALGPATPPVAQVTVDQVVLTEDAFAGALSWDQVVGLDTRQVNIEVLASGLPVAAMPDRVAVSLLSRLPNHAEGPGTLSSAIGWDLARAGTDPADANRVRYRVSRPLADAGVDLAVETRLKEVATVARIGGTSDAEFRRALGWARRGQAVQPGGATTSTGSATGEIPDARTLFRTGGCEVLDVRVTARPNWKVPGAVARLIRNPADVFYYSGHGRIASGKLAVDTGTSPASCPSSGPFADWLGPADLSEWRSPMDTNVLILAGCSVLHIDFGTSPPTGPGIAWTTLLKAKGGPLDALLGYRKGAPCDTPNGSRIAKAMAARMAQDSASFAQDWLTANGDNNADNAVAIDHRGYWSIDSGFFGGYDITGPQTIP